MTQLITDLAQIRGLFLASPFGNTHGDFADRDFGGFAGRTVVDGAVPNAVVMAELDASSSQPIILYRFVFGAAGLRGMRAIPPLLIDTALWGKTQGCTSWMANVPQSAAFATFRRYLEKRWPYLHPDDGSGWRIMGDTLDAVVEKA